MKPRKTFLALAALVCLSLGATAQSSRAQTIQKQRGNLPVTLGSVERCKLLNQLLLTVGNLANGLPIPVGGGGGERVVPPALRAATGR
jgi:hypothetical protein